MPSFKGVKYDCIVWLSSVQFVLFEEDVLVAGAAVSGVRVSIATVSGVLVAGATVSEVQVSTATVFGMLVAGTAVFMFLKMLNQFVRFHTLLTCTCWHELQIIHLVISCHTTATWTVVKLIV